MTAVAKVTIIGVKEFAEQLARIGGAAAGQALVGAVTAGALIVQNAAKEKAPFRSGTLRRSIRTEPAEVSATHAAVVIGTGEVYAAVQEFGAVIVPVRARALRFEDPPKSGHIVFAQRVHVPAHPYLRPAMDENIGNVAIEIGEALRRLIEAAL